MQVSIRKSIKNKGRRESLSLQIYSHKKDTRFTSTEHRTHQIETMQYQYPLQLRYNDVDTNISRNRPDKMNTKETDLFLSFTVRTKICQVENMINGRTNGRPIHLLRIYQGS